MEFGEHIEALEVSPLIFRPDVAVAAGALAVPAQIASFAFPCWRVIMEGDEGRWWFRWGHLPFSRIWNKSLLSRLGCRPSWWS